MSISCNATDSDHDSLSFNWSASGGEILGSGSQVDWEAPISAGVYWRKVEVTDGKAIASDSLSIWVNDGFLLAQTRSGVFKVTLDGTSSLFYENGREIEVLGERIFFGPSGNILELDLEGHEVRRITRPLQIPWATTFVVLADAGFAFVNNQNDSIYFMASDGTFLASREIVVPSPTRLQGTKGITIGDTLFMADTGAYGVVAYDLDSYDGWVLRSFQSQSVRPTDVDYCDGIFYISDLQKTIRKFTQSGGLETIATLPQQNLCALAIVSSYAYSVCNFAGLVYRVNICTGQYDTLVTGLDYPQDIEFVRIFP